jgi:predicted transcriptional regulator
MIHDDDDELTEEDRLAVAASREYFQKGGQGLSLEEVAASLGFTMDQVRGRKGG